jgi:hypothetical protein
MLMGDGFVTLEAATGDQAQASEAIEATIDQPRGGDPAVTAAGFKPATLPRRARCIRYPVREFRLHCTQQAVSSYRPGHF